MHKVLNSLKNACYGLQYCFSTQRNMTIHTMVGVIVVVMGIILRVSLYEMLFLLAAIMLVLVSEAFNTAIEKTIDLYTAERNSLAQVAKDVAAGAVLLTALFAVIVGLVVLSPPLWQALRSMLSL